MPSTAHSLRLTIFHRFAAQPRSFYGRDSQTFNQQRLLKTVLKEPVDFKGQPILLTTLAEKYQIKIAKSLGISKQQFPSNPQRT